MRLCPVVPFAVSNYFLGLGDTPFLPFLVATVVGTLPWVVLNVALGGSGHELLSSGGEFDELLGMVLSQATLVFNSPQARAVATVATMGLVYLIFSSKKKDAGPGSGSSS